MAQYLSSSAADQVLLELHDTSAVAEARRVALRLAAKEELSDTESGNVALVATELATNLIKHAKHGRMVMRILGQGKDAGIEIMALDSGPGIKDLAQSMSDGYSTTGSPGTGLGAIKRLAGEFDLHSIPDKGTAVLARILSGHPRPQPTSKMEFGVVCLPMPGEQVCGDGWGFEHLPDKYTYALVDGLGHGPDAGIAALAALSVAKEYRDKAPAEIVERAHGMLRTTRGAALAIGEIDSGQGLVRFCGVGNIAASIASNGGVRHLVSHNGIVGQEARKIAEFTYPWSSDSLLIMHTDGLASRWNIQNYPALIKRHSALIAGVLYRDFSRGRDDTTILAARESHNGGRYQEI